MVEHAPVAMNESEQALVVSESSLPYQRSVAENPLRHFPPLSLSLSLSLLSHRSAAGEGEETDVPRLPPHSSFYERPKRDPFSFRDLRSGWVPTMWTRSRFSNGRDRFLERENDVGHPSGEYQWWNVEGKREEREIWQSSPWCILPYIKSYVPS